MSEDDLYRIETPEQIDVAYDIAGIGSRFLAALVDHILLALGLAIGCVLVAYGADLLQLGFDEFIVLTLFGIGVYLALCAYYIFWETIWNGQTPGKRLVGLRMVRTGGRPLGFLGSAIRNFIRLIDFLPVLYGLGMIVMFVDRRSRRLGDLAAGCIAIRERRPITLDALATPSTSTAPLPTAASITIPNLQALKREDYDIVQEFLQRRASLSAEARHRLSLQLLEGLQQRLGFPVQGDAETFLQLVAAEYRALEQIDQQALNKR